MDMITKSLLDEFSLEQELGGLREDEQFEHFAAYITVKRQHGDTSSTSDVVTGKGSDGGIDGFAAIVNGTLVTNVDELEDIATNSGHLEVNFIFVQAQRSPSFESSKIGDFGFGVLDFFSNDPKLRRNDKIEDAAALMKAIYQTGTKLRRRLPTCRLYYVTTGRWEHDPDLIARINAIVKDLEKATLFSSVEFNPVGADGIRKLYLQARKRDSTRLRFR